MPSKLGENILARMTPGAARSMQEAIAAAGGREVFFAGELDASGRVWEARVCARGHESAVPALFDGLGARDVVVHNHPSGDLSPSGADLELASMYSAHGHGVYIIDNEVTRVYVVVEPFLPKDTERLDAADLARALQPNGPVARALPHFEVRPQQTKMMQAVAEAFNNNGIAVTEAPTGVGKTIAYLLPAALWAVRNKERIVISTRTINLQEQIVFKDIPVLQRCFKEPFTACLVKGRGNYICLRKLQRAQAEATLYDDEKIQEQLNALYEWVERTEDGSLSDLPFAPIRELWERVCSEADSCGMGRCPDQKRCFVGKARREIAKADLIVVNHHMLFSDIAIKVESENFHTAQAVLPSYKRVIFDEAHSLEDSATEYFGVSATRLGMLATLGRFYRVERTQERGLLPLIRARLIKDCTQLSVSEFEEIQTLLVEEIQPMIQQCRNSLDTAFTALRELAGKSSGQIGRDIKWRLTQEVLETAELRRLHNDYVGPAVEDTRMAVRKLMQLHSRLREIPQAENEDEPPLYTETLQLRAYANRLERIANALAECTSAELANNTVRWIEADAFNDKRVRVVRCPLDVGKPLADWVYANLDTVVMASATLTVRKDFGYLFGRLGLDAVPEERIDTLILDSPFDFDKQAVLCVVDDLPEPNDKGFQEACIGALRQALGCSRGHAFVLFTSFSALNHAANTLSPELRRAGITPLRQGETSRTLLLDRFRSDAGSVLFATDSFWEGVDVAGESLQCVIMPKLPFRVPTEPILQARAEAIEAGGGNAFMQYSVPQAVIKFRQGFGRLIRRRTDRGAIVVLDRRILTKYYGKIFLESLPAVRLLKGPHADGNGVVPSRGYAGVFRQLAAFFGHPEASEPAAQEQEKD